MFPSILLCGLLLTGLVSSLTCNTSNNVKPRIFVLTDISNEPDDQQSLVRLLLHADQYTVEGLVVTTSYWLNYTTYPEHVLDVIDGYEKVTANLNAHSVSGFPAAASLRPLVKSSHHVYGLAALINGTLSSGAELLISAVDASAEPLYVQVWGGASVIAEALDYVQRTRSSCSTATFVSRLRVYSISDQDDAGPWIREKFPGVQYIASVAGFNMYGRATWVGISGEEFNYFDPGGPDTSLVQPDYLAEHFQIGPLGEKYPDVMFIMEGDSPALLYTMQNGLNSPEHPEYGSWGGRYTLVDISRRSLHYADSADWVVGKDNKTHVSNQATIWRWRKAFQNEMAARVQWSLGMSYNATVHPPSVSVNGSCGYEPLEISAHPLQEVFLDASQSSDPDANGTDALTFEWIHYREVTSARSPNWAVTHTVPRLNITCIDAACKRAGTIMPSVDAACGRLAGNLGGGCQSYHVILSVTNGGETPMTRYKRVIIDVKREVVQEKRRLRDEI